MAPAGKRKRERGSTESGDTGHRPSPHRPGNSNMVQRDERQGGGGGQRRSIGGRNNNGPRRNNNNNNNNERRNSYSQDVNSIPVTARTPTTPGPMSPPPIPSVSRTQTPTPSTTPVNEASPEALKAPRIKYYYDYVTEQRLSTWKGKGRREVVELGISAREDEDLMELSMLFQEIIHTTLEGLLEPGEAGDVVMDIIGSDPLPSDVPPTFDARSIFLDCLSITIDGVNETGNAQVLYTFITATGVSPALMRQKLDGKLLQDTGLTRNTFIKVGIRKVTNILYRQANYNLLREETEGYSKLMTDLFTTSTQDPSDENISDLFERVKGLIGTFDLDVGRVLDVTLDFCASILIRYNRFIVKFLRASSWWPRSPSPGELEALNYGISNLPRWALPDSEVVNLMEGDEEEILRMQIETRDAAFWNRAREVGLNAFFELGGRRFDATDFASLNSSGYDGADLEWINITGTMPPPGNRVAAQLLGFKLRFYTSDSRDPDETMPGNLMGLATLLIKIGFISFRDLYEHLWPLDEVMLEVKEKRLKALEEIERKKRPAGTVANALTAAKALSDESAPKTQESGKVTPTKVEPVALAASKPDADKSVLDPTDHNTNQKVSLLINLLTIGALPESLFILGKFPWLVDAYPEELLPLIHRILHHSIDKLHNAAHNIDTPKFIPKKYAELDPGITSKGRLRLIDEPEKRPIKWSMLDTLDDSRNAKNYTFYWSQWSDNVPVCQSIEDLFTLCSTFLNQSGVNIGKDAVLLTKLARIGNHSLNADPSEYNLTRWKDLLKRTLVPALSLTKENPAIANLIYDMLRHYPVSERFAIYAEWNEGQISRLPAMKVAYANTNRETLSTLKRISKTNVTEMARRLAKVAYSSPGTVFREVFNQIEAYSNLVEVVVECGRYFTELGYDVLVWALLSSLGGKNRSRVQENGMATSRWLQALALFSGKVFKRYSIMGATPVLQYVNDQLCSGNPTDLIVLEEIITHMAGIVSDTDFNNAQLEAMTGGDVLRRQTLINLQDKRHESTKTAKRLIRALVDSNLAPQLLISIAQTRQKSAYDIPDEDAHTKLIGTLTDETQRILVQFLELLRSNISHEDFDKMVPDVIQLIAEFGLEPEFAFLICRASLSKKITSSLSPKSNGVSTNGTLEGDASVKGSTGPDDSGDSVMQDAGNKSTEEVNGETVDNTTNDDVSMVDAASTSKADSPPVLSSLSDSYDDVLEPIADAIKDMGPQSRWTVLNPRFYVSFWQLSLSDLILPLSSYEAEISRLARETADVMKDRSDMTRAGMNRKEEQKRLFTKTADDLRAELKQQIVTYQRTKARLMKERLNYFIDCHGKWDGLNEAIIEQCLFPRALLSPTDAMYCFQIIKFLHSSGTPHFRTLGLYTKIFSAKRLRLFVFQCSIREAENLGRFLKDILGELSRWHADKAVYEKEALGPKSDFPGYAKLIGADGKPKTVLSYEDFRRSVFRIHKGLNTALRECLGDSEWTHVRNAITILKGVHEHFPAIDFMGKHFFSVLTDIGKREKDKRDDLSLSANALLADLKKREKDWVMPQAFSTGADPSLDQSTIVPSSSSQLKPTAPEFKPRVSSAKDVEDGEVKDAKSVPTSEPTTVASPVTKDATTTVDSQQANKPSVPVTAPESRTESRITNPPPRSDNTSRNISSASQNRGLTQQSDLIRHVPSSNGVSSLPLRPEPPPRYNDGRSGIPRSSERRDVRDGRMMEGRLSGRDHSRDFGEPNRRGPDSMPRNFDDRVPLPNRDGRLDNPPPQWSAEQSRDIRDDGRGGREKVNGIRTPDQRPSRDSTTMAPPRPSHNDRPLVNPDRIHLVNSDRPEPLHPERAALIGVIEPIRADSTRRDRDSRPGSRPQSPRRGSERSAGSLSQTGPEYRRDDHANTGRLMSLDSQSRARPDDVMGPGSRLGRNVPSSDRLRDSFQHASPAPRQIDPDHGRLVSSPRHNQQDPNFGRLAPTTPDIPSGPRSRDNRGINRAVSTPQLRGDPMNSVRELARPPSPDKQPPTGPSSDRGNMPNRSASRRSLAQVETNMRMPLNSATQLTSSTPASPTVHPDRARQLSNAGNLGLQTSQPQSQPSTPTSVAPTTGVHPDRLRQLQSDEHARLPPSQPSSNSRASRNSGNLVPQAPSPTNAAPKGPRNQSSTSSPTMGSHGFSAPTGPAASGDRSLRGPRNRGAVGPERQLAGINNLLQQSTSNDRPAERISIRGHSERNVNANQVNATHFNGPNGPSVIPRPEPIPLKAPVPDLINPARADLITSGRGSNGADDQSSNRSGGGRDHHEHRSRHTRRTSRSRSPKRSGPEEERSTRGSRTDDRRGGATDIGGREREPRDRDREGGRTRERDPRRSGRDSDVTRGTAPTNVGGRSSGREVDGPRELIGGPVSGVRDIRDSTSRRDERGSRDSRGGGGGDDPEWNGRRSDLRDGERQDRRSSRSGDNGRGGDGGSGRKRRGEDGVPERGNDKRSRQR